MSRWRRARSWLLVLVTTLVLLELVLQAGAFLVWSLARHDAGGSAPGSGENVVLCTGDSFTYGIGSSSPDQRSYPAQLERILAERSGSRWKVANCGWPGQDSWDVLRKLDQQLDRWHPALVYLLVGVNDLWSQPELHTLGEYHGGALESGESFHWRWRTRRFVAALRGLFLPGPATAAAAASAPAAAADPVAAGWSAWRTGDFANAEACFLRALQQRPEDPAIHSHLAMTYYSAGRTREMEEQIELCRRNFASRPGAPAAAEALVEALAASGKGDAALALAQKLVLEFPESRALWQTIGCESIRSGENAAARSALDRAIALVPESGRDLKGYLHRQRACLLFFSDALETARSAVLAHLLDRDRKATVQLLQWAARACTPENLARVCAELELNGADREEIQALQKSSTGVSGPLEVLQAHVRQAIERCVSAGAVPVLVGYPFPHAELEEAMRAAAVGPRVGLLLLSRPFARAVMSAAGEPLFAAEGHCNDRGYEVMAGLVAEDVVRRAGSGRRR